MAISAPPRPRGQWSRSEPHRPSVIVTETSLLLTVLAVAAVVVAGVVAFVVIGNIGPNFQGTIERITPIGSSQVVVELQVANLGGSRATPTCQIDMSSSASAFTGATSFRPQHPIPGRSAAVYSILIPVTTDGATRVNSDASNVGCR